MLQKEFRKNRLIAFSAFTIIGALLIWLLFTLFTPGYIKRTEIEQNIIADASKNCNPRNTCVLNLLDVTDFDWDSLYIFRDSHDASRYIYSKAEMYDSDISCRHYTTAFQNEVLFFLKDRKLVHCLNIYQNKNNQTPVRFLFHTPQKSFNYYKIDRRNPRLLSYLL